MHRQSSIRPRASYDCNWILCKIFTSILESHTARIVLRLCRTFCPGPNGELPLWEMRSLIPGITEHLAGEHNRFQQCLARYQGNLAGNGSEVNVVLGCQRSLKERISLLWIITRTDPIKLCIWYDAIWYDIIWYTYDEIMTGVWGVQ